MNEFDLKEGSRKNGIKGLIGGIITFIVIPLILLYVLGYLEDIIISNTSDDINKDDMRALFKIAYDILIMSLIFGIPAIVLKTLGKFYPEGNRARLTFKLLYGVYIAFWLFIITSGGIITVDASKIAASMAGNSSDYLISRLTMVLDVSGLMIIIILLTLLKNIIPIAEYKGARKEYLERMGNSKKQSV